MKSKLLKTAFLEIKVRKKIFISILCMALLGVGFFAGIKATAPSMKNTLDSYYSDLNMLDIEVSSFSGITDSSVEKLTDIGEIKDIEKVISVDKISIYKDRKPVIKIYNMPTNVSEVKLIEGRFPENELECVIDSSVMNSDDFELGSYIEIEDNSGILKNKKLKIVGIVNSPIYLSRQRGSTNLASGTIDYFMYVPLENFNTNGVYSSLYLTLDTDEFVYSDEYEELLSSVVAEIKEKDSSFYVTTLFDNISYSNYIQDTERVDNLAKVFPIIFFVVATLISLTSMTRMVEEQRVEIGTLKSLGYTKKQISIKYILYASIATIAGGVIGILIGVNLIPRIIYMLYSMMYTCKELIVDYNIAFSFLGLLIAYICIIGATLFVVLRELRSTPSVLMRPKAPKSGKRVFLEKIPCIWNRLSFTNKVTIRNMFRYKKRFLMTILGIAGCTSLIFAGFGLKDSVTKLLPSQYENIFLYDIQAISADKLTEEDIALVRENEYVSNYQKSRVEVMTAEKDDKKYENIQMITINDDSNIDEFIKIVDYNTGDKIVLSDGIVITEKLASLLDVDVNDEIKIITSLNESVDVKISAIAENYLGHYMYLSSTSYLNLFGKEYVDNALLITTSFDEEEEQLKVSEELLKNDNFAKVVVTETVAGMMDDTMEQMNYVVWILIVAAGILAFCVLYNLANVNISERIRELATIKVLGFYHKEVHNYVEKETTILTIIGIFFGLIMGYFLSMMIIKTCELDTMMFSVDYSIDCYIYSILITVLFTLIVSLTTYFNLKKINMIESLKSVE